MPSSSVPDLSLPFLIHNTQVLLVSRQPVFFFSSRYNGTSGEWWCVCVSERGLVVCVHACRGPSVKAFGAGAYVRGEAWRWWVMATPAAAAAAAVAGAGSGRRRGLLCWERRNAGASSLMEPSSLLPHLSLALYIVHSINPPIDRSIDRTHPSIHPSIHPPSRRPAARGRGARSRL